MIKLDLDGAWEFKAEKKSGAIPESCAKAEEWLPAVVPGTVHTDLMRNGVIPDPFFRMNETQVQWIDAVQWRYRRTFEVPEILLQEKTVRLWAYGLDTYAAIVINGNAVGTTANMFIEHSFDIRRALRPGKNTIEVLFDSPVARSKALERKEGVLNVALEPHRVYARKAQYSFSWDWGPKLTTSGIWRKMVIEGYSDAVLRDPFARVVSLNAREAVVRFTADVEGGEQRNRAVRFRVSVDGTPLAAGGTVKNGKASATIRIPRPRLWWPNGQGDQPMYSAELVLFRGNEVLGETTVTFAVRTIQLLQKKDEEGESFVFVVNGRKIFCKGADWIPADNFLPRIDDARYEMLLRLARDAHMNMVRVWGGGIYEDDRFYDACDRMGLLVWQDFMFACGEYPDTKWFLDSVREEAERAIKRLRNHPSIAVWCGNNECEWLFCMQNPGKHPDQMTGSKIFRELLPDACRKFDGTRPYWRSSPFGEGFPNDESNGNHHQWSVWSSWKDYAEYENDNARFVTEFGFQAPANVKTMEECTLPRDRHPQSIVMEHHNKQIEGPERLMRFMSGHFRVETEFSRFTYLGQLVQAEALKRAVEHWRRRKFNTAGSLFWQLNDCWPVASWAVVDSALRPKAAYFYAKRFFAPVLLSFRRTDAGMQVWLTSDLPAPLTGTVLASRRSFDGTIVWSKEVPCRLTTNSSRVVLTADESMLAGLDPATEYLLAEWHDEKRTPAENRHFFAEPKHLTLPDPGLVVEILPGPQENYIAHITAAKFAKGVRLEISGEDAVFEDNVVDIDAGATRTIAFRSFSSHESLKKRVLLEFGR